jgi:hypothetical protein
MNFLDLPPQVRTKIYTYLICNSPLNSAPSLAAFHALDPYQRLFRHSASIAEAKIERLIHYPSRIYLGFEGLLRTSRVVRGEVKNILEGLRKVSVDCTLDVIVERGNGGGVWPSWMICPARNPTVRNLEVHVRVFGDEFGLEIGAMDAPVGPVLLREFSDGALAFTHAHVGRERCRTLAFAIVAVIARFIERGARWGHARGDISIETLVLHFMDAGQEVKDEKRFLELTPPTPPTPVDTHDNSTEDYWETDTLISEADEAIAFALGDSSRVRPTSSDDMMADEAIQAPDLLRMVDLILKPLCREEKYMLHRRKHHFSAVHLSLLRRNVRRLMIVLDGKVRRRMRVVEE